MPSESNRRTRPERPTRRKFLTAAGASATVTLAGCNSGSPSSARGDYPEGVVFETGWPTFAHDDANTGYDPDADPASAGEVAWRSEFGVPTTGVTVSGDAAFVPTDPLRAVDAATGSVRWTHPYDLRHPPAVEDGTVYVPHESDPALLGLDAESGDVVWQADLPASPTTPPVFANRRERLFVALRGGTLCGIDREDAAVAWTQSIFGEVSAPLAFNLYHLVAVTSVGEVYCFTDSGHPAWRHNRHAGLRSPPVFGDERVYVGGRDGTVAALDRRNGGLAWERDVSGFVEEPLAFDGDRIYAVAAGALTALNAANGERAWRFEADEGVRSSPAVVGDTVFVGTKGGALVALDASGGGPLSGPKRWSVSLGTYVGHWLAAAGGRVYAPVVPPRSESGPNRLVAVE